MFCIGNLLLRIFDIKLRALSRPRDRQTDRQRQREIISK